MSRNEYDAVEYKAGFKRMKCCVVCRRAQGGNGADVMEAHTERWVADRLESVRGFDILSQNGILKGGRWS